MKTMTKTLALTAAAFLLSAPVAFAQADSVNGPGRSTSKNGYDSSTVEGSGNSGAAMKAGTTHSGAGGPMNQGRSTSEERTKDSGAH